MKTKITTFILAILFTGSVISQVTFSVKPGFNLMGADFGYKINKVEPYIGLKSIGGKFTYEEANTDSVSNEIKLNLLLPHIGAKFQIMEKESIKSFINVSLFKPMVSGKMVSGGEENEDFKNELNKISTVGFEVGFASEYFFDEHFSLGGEFGFRYAFMKYKNDEEPDPFTYNLNLNMTYALVSFNYYF